LQNDIIETGTAMIGRSVCKTGPVHLAGTVQTGLLLISGSPFNMHIRRGTLKRNGLRRATASRN